MALVKCVECGKEVSDKAKSCPNCGCPINEKKEKTIKVEQPKKPVKKNKPLEIIVAITCGLSFLPAALGYGFVMGTYIPLGWFITMCIVCGCIDGDKYDKSWYRKLRNWCGIVTLIVLAISVVVTIAIYYSLINFVWSK